MTTSAREWRAAREEDIRRAYADKECWNDLDSITCQHPYNFNAIERWPLDAAVICKPTDRASVLLGSIKAACSLEDIFKTLSVKVTYFQHEKVFHIKCHLEDTTLKPPHRWEERIPDLVASCLEQWKIVCGQLWKQSMLAVTRGESMHVLFHCFGGINRSAGALCAWLVVGCNYSAEDAVQLLLEKRLSLRPWHNRPYVLEALWKLEGLRAWNWVRRAQINLHHCSSGETVPGERAKSVANCCLSVMTVRDKHVNSLVRPAIQKMESVHLHVFVWSNWMTSEQLRAVLCTKVGTSEHDVSLRFQSIISCWYVF